MLEIFIILLIVAADQITKYLTVTYLKPLGSIPVIEGIFNLTYVENRGAAFGILQNQRWFLVILPIIIVAAVVFYLVTHRRDSVLRRISLAVILGGALGNLIDRIFHGYVIDMLQTAFIEFPVFNVADSAVVCGTILLAIQMLFLDKPQS
jgi:signal peptidase II